MKPPHIIALVVIVLCMVATLLSLSSAMAPHVTIPQAMASTQDVVQVPGSIVKGTVVFNSAKGQLQFDVMGIDPGTRKPIPSQRMSIVYTQPKPENFDSANEVEAVGKFENGVFRASNVLVKCPSKYGDDKAAKVAEK